MTIRDVEQYLQLIDEQKGDIEAAHALEDALYLAVLTAIAEGRAENPEHMAMLCTRSQQILTERWYA